MVMGEREMADLLGAPVVLGAGPVGRTVAAVLVARGIRPRVVTRSGTAIEGTGPCLADLADADAARVALGGASVVFQCAQPPYHRWPQEFPRLQRSVVRACEASGAVLVAIENLYGYGPVPVPLTEDRPMKPTTRKGTVRAAMWAELLDAHRAGRVRAAAVRASDFFGAGVLDSAYGDRFFGPLVSGGKAQMLGSPSVFRMPTQTIPSRGCRSSSPSTTQRPSFPSDTSALETSCVKVRIAGPGVSSGVLP